MSSRLPFVFAFTLLTASASAVRPEPAAPAPATPAPAAPATPAVPSAPVPAYVLKNRSNFSNAAEVTRAPFWPIGWVKKQAVVAGPAPVVEAPKVALDPKNFKVTSILLGAGTSPSLAVINGRAYSEGEFLRMPKVPGVAPVRIRVQRIADGAVVLQNATQTLTAELQRPELNNNKRPDEPLLSEDR